MSATCTDVLVTEDYMLYTVRHLLKIEMYTFTVISNKKEKIFADMYYSTR